MKPSTLTNFSGFIGQSFLRFPRYIFLLTLFIVRALNPRNDGRWAATYRTIVSQLIFSGIDALPFIGLLALVTGMAITSQTLLALQALGERAEIIELVVRLVVFELATLITLVLLIGRTGSAICVDLGSMKLNKEIEGLEMLGININQFFLAPRILGAAVSQMLLVTYFALIAIVSGVFLLAMLMHPGYLSYFPDIARSLSPFDLLFFLGKNFFFGLLIAGIACYHGLQVRVSRTELPQQTQKAIVNSFSLVFILNALFTLLTF